MTPFHYIKLIVMLILPKKTKFNKIYSRKSLSKSQFALTPIFSNGLFGLIADKSSFVIPQQINSALRLIRKNLKKKSKIWIYFSPNVTITKKPNETRMGKGKGPVKYWSFLIKKNQLLFEFIGMNKSIVQKTVKASKVKLPFNTTFLTRY